jgi:hypothetical protein
MTLSRGPSDYGRGFDAGLEYAVTDLQETSAVDYECARAAVDDLNELLRVRVRGATTSWPLLARHACRLQERAYALSRSARWLMLHEGESLVL